MNENYNYNDYQSAVTGSVNDLYHRIIVFLPNIIAAVIVLLAGWTIGSFLGGLVRRGLDAIGMFGFGNQLGLHRLSERSGHRISISRIVEWVIKWFFIIAS